MAAIEAEKLRRTYRQSSGFVRRRTKSIEAVRGIDFEVNEGELFGLLGPNGAGKTTTIKMLVTLLIPTSGAARVLGHDVVHSARTVRRNIGYVFGGDRGAYERLSGLDNLRYFSELYGVPPKLQKRRIPQLLELVGRTVVEIEAYGLPAGALERVRASPGVTSVSVEEREHVQLLLVQAPKGLELTQQLLGCLGDVRVGRVAAREPTLEDAYVSLVTGS